MHAVYAVSRHAVYAASRHAVYLVVSADVSVELAVCSLLLGDSNQAEDALRLGPRSAPNEADQAVRSFVMVSHFTASCIGSWSRFVPQTCFRLVVICQVLLSW